MTNGGDGAVVAGTTSERLRTRDADAFRCRGTAAGGGGGRGEPSDSPSSTRPADDASDPYTCECDGIWYRDFFLSLAAAEARVVLAGSADVGSARSSSISKVSSSMPNSALLLGEDGCPSSSFGNPFFCVFDGVGGLYRSFSRLSLKRRRRPLGDFVSAGAG